MQARLPRRPQAITSRSDRAPEKISWLLPSFSTARIRSRRAAALSNCRSSAACSISSSISLASPWYLPSSRRHTWPTSWLYSFWETWPEHTAQQRPMWALRQGRFLPISRGNFSEQVGSLKVCNAVSRAFFAPLRPA